MYVSYQKFENSMDFLHVIDDDKSHYVYIKDFKIFMFHKTKNIFVKAVWGVSVAKMRWQSIKKIVWALMEHNL